MAILRWLGRMWRKYAIDIAPGRALHGEIVYCGLCRGNGCPACQGLGLVRKDWPTFSPLAALVRQGLPVAPVARASLRRAILDTEATSLRKSKTIESAARILDDLLSRDLVPQELKDRAARVVQEADL